MLADAGRNLIKQMTGYQSDLADLAQKYNPRHGAELQLCITNFLQSLYEEVAEKQSSGLSQWTRILLETARNQTLPDDLQVFAIRILAHSLGTSFLGETSKYLQIECPH